MRANIVLKGSFLPPPKIKGRVHKHSFVAEGQAQASQQIKVVAQAMKDMAPAILEEMDVICAETASKVSEDAILAAPVYLSSLRKSIRPVKQTKASWRVEAGGPAAPYAPYVEYGTSTGWPSIEKLLDWMSKKGIPGGEPVARNIQRSIYRRGTRAHPFFNRSIEKHRREFYSRMGSIVA